MIAYRIYLILFILTVSGTADAERNYIGGGFSSVNLNSDHLSVNDQSSTGYYLLMGKKTENWGIEATATGGISFDTEPTTGIFYPKDNAEYGILDLGFKIYFHPENHAKLSPWVGAGFGLHFIDWQTFFYRIDGYGYSITGGIDYELEPNWLVRGGAVYHDFTSDDTYGYGPYDGSTKQLNLILIYMF
jgi:hypothetical protein